MKALKKISGMMLIVALAVAEASIPVMAAEETKVEIVATDNVALETATVEEVYEETSIIEKIANGIADVVLEAVDTFNEAVETLKGKVEEMNGKAKDAILQTEMVIDDEILEEEYYNVSTVVFTEDGMLILPRPVKDGKVFIEWNTEEDGSGYSYKAGEIVDPSNIMLYSIWEDGVEVKTEEKTKDIEEIKSEEVVTEGESKGEKEELEGIKAENTAEPEENIEEVAKPEGNAAEEGVGE